MPLLVQTAPKSAYCMGLCRDPVPRGWRGWLIQHDALLEYCLADTNRLLLECVLWSVAHHTHSHIGGDLGLLAHCSRRFWFFAIQLCPLTPSWRFLNRSVLHLAAPLAVKDTHVVGRWWKCCLFLLATLCLLCWLLILLISDISDLMWLALTSITFQIFFLSELVVFLRYTFHLATLAVLQLLLEIDIAEAFNFFFTFILSFQLIEQFDFELDRWLCFFEVGLLADDILLVDLQLLLH